MATRSVSVITRSVSRFTENATLLAILLCAVTAAAQGVPPWGATKTADDQEARSVLVQGRDEPLYSLPTSSSSRRGAAAKGARLPLYGKRHGAGCKSDWLLVGPTAWICGDHVEPSADAPPISASEAPPLADGMPQTYYFVGPDGSFGYDALRTAEDTKPVSSLEPGFSIAAVQIAKKNGADPFALTTKGIWIPVRDLRPAKPLVFRGYEVEKGLLDRGWVVTDTAERYAEPNGHRLGGASRRRFDIVTVAEVEMVKKRSWVRTADGDWLDASNLRFPRPSDRPSEAGADERWIDVDLESEVLTAYEGSRPVFATLVSTGKGHGDDPMATPTGTSRIWVKLRTTDMTNLEDDDASRYYAIEDVPWVMFFNKGVGLHGAFWHRSFGHVRSHGCVNLTPLDAERLFRWAGPRLPVGWTAALPTDYDPGTLVRVR
jgi:L,D-transpeptidase catalytic domain